MKPKLISNIHCDQIDIHESPDRASLKKDFDKIRRKTGCAKIAELESAGDYAHVCISPCKLSDSALSKTMRAKVQWSTKDLDEMIDHLEERVLELEEE